MKNRLRALAIILSAVILLSLAGYLILHYIHRTGKKYSKPISISNAADLYNEAISKIQNVDTLTLDVTDLRHIRSGDQIFTEEIYQTISYRDLRSENTAAFILERQTIGTHTFDVTEHYANGTVYTEIEDSCFVSTMSKPQFQSRYAPATPLDVSLYTEISGLDTGEIYMILFQSPTAAEAWFDSENIVLTKTWGTAILDRNGKLLKSTYYATIEENNVTLQRAVTVTPTIGAEPFDIPEDTLAYTPLDYTDGPKLLERICGYLLSANNITAKSSDLIFFEAFGDQRSQTIELNTFAGEDWMARVDTDRTLTNTSHEGAVSNYHQIQLFKNNQYSASENGGAFAPDDSIIQTDMKAYTQNLLVNTVMLPKFISGASVSIAEDTMTVTFSANDAFVDQLLSYICQTLYQQPDLLHTLNSKHTLSNIEAHIKIDTKTGFPLSSGISYRGTHEFNGFGYQLEYSINQSYDIISQTSQDKISETAGA